MRHPLPPRNYERHLDTAYAFMKQHGYDAVKSGYVGNIIPKGNNHYNQRMVNHYQYALEKAADYHIMVNATRGCPPYRTVPDMAQPHIQRICKGHGISGIRRFQAVPCHRPFRSPRLIGGPMDYTPGIFEMDISKVNPDNSSHANCTIANQLGIYVVMSSPAPEWQPTSPKTTKGSWMPSSS